METSELITEMRDWAAVQGPGTLANLLQEAADRLEELDERLGIVTESLMAAEKQFDEHLKEIGVREE